MRHHERFMIEAMDCALKGVGNTSPNPMVGAVIVKNNVAVAKAGHLKFGGPHAEVRALRQAGPNASGATLYVTLEPCSTFAKTPPCVDAIVQAGIREVLIGSIDPNPAHRGRAVRWLKSRGVRVRAGILKSRTDALIVPFRKWITTGMPYCVLKEAMSLDGKIATSGGESKWISSATSRRLSHRMRKHADAVMVGIRTVEKDDPELSTHGSGSREPLKIVVDSAGRISLKSRLIRRHAHRVIVATTGRIARKKEMDLGKLGVRLIKTRSRDGRVNPIELFRALGKINIGSILVEGGGELAASLLEQKLVDRIAFFVAPVLIGGAYARTSVEGRGIRRLADALRIREMRTTRLGPDVLFEGTVQYGRFT